MYLIVLHRNKVSAQTQQPNLKAKKSTTAMILPQHNNSVFQTMRRNIFVRVSLFFSGATCLPPSNAIWWPTKTNLGVTCITEIEQKACHWRNDSLNFILIPKKLNFLTTVRITFFKTHCDSPNSFCHIFVDPSHSYFSRKYAQTVLHNWMLHNLSAFF